ncbi:stabilin-2-like [Actinia tenebrosa]|uniref:Stabilin-2-like n=1 Tax=Actinia tenebrosa TaxID=6105 RepID=A0A6P8I6M8_ACTTE|nr:stabilin-2-like [Actinia tenebrosa]
MEEKKWTCVVFGCFLRVIQLLSVNAEFKAVSRDQLGFKFMNFFHKPGTVLTDSSITVHSSVTDVSSCQLMCLDHTSCLSINVGKKPNQTTLDCELNNSTSLLKPLSLKKREGFDFYGLAEPCFSSSCLNGGTCIPNMNEGTYHCNCSTQIPYLPYLDNHCSVDHSVIKTSGVFHNVFHLEITKKVYSMNYYEAERACAVKGAQMSSLKQLEDGFRAGFSLCSYGWLIDGKARFPILHPVPGCGSSPGIKEETTPEDKWHSRYNVYCYKETDNCNDKNWHQNDQACYKFFLDTKVRKANAAQACVLEGSILGVFNSVAKLTFLQDYLQRKNVTDEHILVGLSQNAVGAWKWANGEAVQSSLWNVIQPTGPIGIVNAVMKSFDNVPDSDEWKLPFVCQKQLP